jgi:hypothetical protein
MCRYPTRIAQREQSTEMLMESSRTEERIECGSLVIAIFDLK